MRWAGLATVISAVLSVIGDLLRLFVDVESSQTATTTPYALVFLLYLLGAVLLLLGLVGLYASQSEAAGALGLVTFLAAFLATALLVGVLWFELFITPSLATRAPGLAKAAGPDWLHTRVPIGDRRLAVVRGGHAAGPHLPKVGCRAPHGRGGGGFRAHTAGGHRLLGGYSLVGLRPLHG